MAISEVSASDRFLTPYAQCGIIFVTWKDGTQSSGSCAVIGRNDILTAGHVVYNPDRGGWADSFEFFFGADYNNKTDRFDSRHWVYSTDSISFTWSAITWPDGLYADNNNETVLDSESQYDVALIGVSVPLGDVTGWLGVAPGRDLPQTAQHVGYPSDGTGMMKDTVSVTRSRFWGVYDANTQSLESGSSGGPLITSDNYLIGVRTSGGTSNSTWADIGFLWDRLYPELAKNDSLLGGAVADTTPPTIAITSDKTSLKAGETATIRFTLSESSTDFTSADLTVSGGTVSNFTGSGESYIAIFKPTANSTATGVVSVASSKFSDAAGNFNADGAETNNTVTLAITTLVTPTATSGADSLTGSSGNDTIDGLEGNDTIRGAAGNDLLSGSAGADFLNGDYGDDTLAGGTGNDQLYGGKDSDTAAFSGAYSANTVTALYEGKNGALSGYRVVGPEGTDTLSTDIEFLSFGSTRYQLKAGSVIPLNPPPTIAITSNKASINAGETATIAFALSAPSTDFTAADVTVTGGTLSNFVGSGASYTATFTPTANPSGNGSITVASGKFSDAAGNFNADGAEANNTVTLAIASLLGPDYSNTTIAWTRLLGTSSYEQADALATGTDGAIYVVGRSEGNLNGQINSGGSDAFLTKYNSDGSISWTRLFESSAWDRAVALSLSEDGAIYVAVFVLKDGQFDALLTKYNRDGTIVWTRMLATSSDDNPSSLTIGLDGGIYLSGYTRAPYFDGQTNAGFIDAFLTKYNSDGTKAWCSDPASPRSCGV